MSRGRKIIDLGQKEYRSSDRRWISPSYPDKMHPARRLACVILGAPLFAAGSWLFGYQVLGMAGHISFIALLLAGTMAFGGLALLGSGVIGR
jgi:fatty acid desaturase